MKQIILDCDNTFGLPFKEIDDGLTLIYLLGRPDIQLMGVTTTFGNGTTDQSYEQTIQLLRKVQHPEIPVWRGQSQPGNPPNEAADFLAKSAADSPKQISILATGPLTNLQAAARIDPHFFQNLAGITCMGGYLQPLRIGWRSLPELNLSADSQAAFTVLQAPCPIVLMTAQICLQAYFSWGDFRSIRFLNAELRRIIWNWLLAFGFYCGIGRFFLWDLVPAVYLSFPELFTGGRVHVTSTPQELNTGKIRLKNELASDGMITLPQTILNPIRFKRIVFEGLQQGSR